MRTPVRSPSPRIAEPVGAPPPNRCRLSRPGPGVGVRHDDDPGHEVEPSDPGRRASRSTSPGPSRRHSRRRGPRRPRGRPAIAAQAGVSAQERRDQVGVAAREVDESGGRRGARRAPGRSADAASTTGTVSAWTAQARRGAHAREGLDPVRGGQIRPAARSGRRDHRDRGRPRPTRGAAAEDGPRRNALVAGQELAAAVERDRSRSRSIRPRRRSPASGGVTSFIGGGSPGGRPTPRPTTRGGPGPGRATNGAMYATSRNGTRMRAPTGRMARAIAERPRARARTGRSSRDENPASWSRRAGMSTSSADDERQGEEPGRREHRVSGSCCGSGGRRAGPKTATKTTTQTSVTRIGFCEGKLSVT